MKISKIIKKEILITTLSITFAAIGMVFLSYSFFGNIAEGNTNTITYGDLEITFNDTDTGMGDSIVRTADIPLLDEAGQQTTPYKFKVTNTGALPLSYKIILEEDDEYITINNLTGKIVNPSDMKLSINGGEASLYSSFTNGIIYEGNLSPGETRTFNLRIWLKSDASNTAIGKHFVTLIKAEATYTPELSDMLSTAIIKDNSNNGKTIQNVESDTMFEAISTPEQTGLWKEERTGKTEGGLPTYFFRGAVQNNYVSLAGKMWRIVRINEDGTIKLILGGNTTTDGYGGTITQFNSTNTEAQYTDYILSLLKEETETWYGENITGSNDLKVANTTYCRDMSNTTNETEITYGSYARANNNTPQFKCPNLSDNLLLKAAAIIADEVVYAGGKIYENNANYFLNDNTQSSGESGYWWSMSPSVFYYGSSIVFDFGGSDHPGFLNCTPVNLTRNFRPVISLNSNVTITGGTGIQSDPYVID